MAPLTRLLTVDPTGKLTADLQTTLGDARHRIVRADSYVAAFTLLHQAEFDAVLIAHALKDRSWRDLIAEIRDMRLTLPVIVTSPDIDDGMWVDALFAGANNLLRMPLDAAEVERMLHEATRRPVRCEHARPRLRRVRRPGGRRLARA